MSGVPRKVGRRIAVALLEVALSLSFARSGNGQTTVATGSIVGIASDPSGAVIAGAQIARPTEFVFGRRRAGLTTVRRYYTSSLWSSLH